MNKMKIDALVDPAQRRGKWLRRSKARPIFRTISGIGPGGIEGESARICERLAAHALSQEDRRPRLVTGDDSIELSAGMVDVLRRVAEAMRQGMAVSAVPRHTVLSTQQAADMLGISRPTLVRMLEEGEIPFVRRRRHRRLYLSDVVEYRKRRRRVADEALSDIVADAQMFGEYDADPEEYREILRAVRHDG
jgi:toxin-antitoxin system, antitoxin component, merR family